MKRKKSAPGLLPSSKKKKRKPSRDVGCSGREREPWGEGARREVFSRKKGEIPLPHRRVHREENATRRRDNVNNQGKRRERKGPLQKKRVYASRKEKPAFTEGLSSAGEGKGEAEA